MRPPLPHSACRDQAGRWPDAHGASGTRPGSDAPATAPPRPRARGVCSSPGRSVVCQRPRPVLKAVRRRPRGGTGGLFCNVSTVMASARKTVRSAWTQSARGLWRDQPVHLRTSSSSKPTSSMAASTRRSIVHRVPATRPTLATVVSWGAKTTDAGRSVGSLRRPRTTSQRRRHGQPAPGIPPWPLGSIPRAALRPAVCWARGQERVHLALPPVPPDIRWP